MDRPQRHRWALGFVFLGTLLTLNSCENIWNWTADDTSFDVLMAEGRDALHDADYALAQEKFTAAIELEPANSDARYYLSKAAVLSAGIDVYSLVTLLTEDEAGSGATEVFGYNIPSANSIYRANWTVLQNLSPVHDGQANIGSFEAKDVDLDLSVAYILRAILRLRDSNGDGIIDDTDVSLADFALGLNGSTFTLDGLQNMTPEQINAMLADVASLLIEGGDLLIDVLGDSGVDVEGLQDLTGSLNGDLSAYFVNNGIPGNLGEGDNDNDGQTDEECFNQIDDDGDGRTDEDTRIAGCL